MMEKTSFCLSIHGEKMEEDGATPPHVISLGTGPPLPRSMQASRTCAFTNPSERRMASAVQLPLHLVLSDGVSQGTPTSHSRRVARGDVSTRVYAHEM